MPSYSIGCFDFFYEEKTEIVYRTLGCLGYTGYKAGTDGNIWSSKIGHQRIGCIWRKLRPGISRGYKRLILYKGTVRKSVYQHRIVLLAFLGKGPQGTECCHINGEGTDNRLENLRWGTRKENCADTQIHGRGPANKPSRIKGRIRPDFHCEKGPRAKLSNNEAREIRRLYQTGIYGQRTLATLFKVSRKTIWLLVHRKTWKYLDTQSPEVS